MFFGVHKLKSNKPKTAESNTTEELFDQLEWIRAKLKVLFESQVVNGDFDLRILETLIRIEGHQYIIDLADTIDSKCHGWLTNLVEQHMHFKFERVGNYKKCKMKPLSKLVDFVINEKIDVKIAVELFQYISHQMTGKRLLKYIIDNDKYCVALDELKICGIWFLDDELYDYLKEKYIPRMKHCNNRLEEFDQAYEKHKHDCMIMMENHIVGNEFDLSEILWRKG